MLVSEAYTHIEAPELLPEFHKCGYVALVHAIVGILNFGNVCGKQIRGACLCIPRRTLSVPAGEDD